MITQGSLLNANASSPKSRQPSQVSQSSRFVYNENVTKNQVKKNADLATRTMSHIGLVAVLAENLSTSHYGLPVYQTNSPNASQFEIDMINRGVAFRNLETTNTVLEHINLIVSVLVHISLQMSISPSRFLNIN